MNNPFEYIPDAACEDAFRELVGKIEALKLSSKPEDINFCRELEAGKMLGVLIAEDERGEFNTLYAFSGQLGEGGFYREGFVGPVFDYLLPEGKFKTGENDISRQSREISLYEREVVAEANYIYERAKERLAKEIDEFKEKCRLSKLERKSKRDSGLIGEVEMAAMIRQSQFEKAELHRLKKRIALELEPLVRKLKEEQSRLAAMKEKRRLDSENLQEWLFSNFRLLNGKGESRSLTEIFADTPMKSPPSGAGECCAPKLFQAAYLQGLKPISIAEYWYGKPKDGAVRIHGKYYPACRGKCLPVLSWMLQGLTVDPPLNASRDSKVVGAPEIIYENQWFCVVDKPSGMLSVPGKVEATSLQEWLADKYPDQDVKMAHRLDQDTSGLIVATFGADPFKVMQSLFAARKAKKTYVADLEGDYESRGIARQGCVELPLAPDWIDRPRQRVDPERGKNAVTDYEFIKVSDDHSRVIFHPVTGRTHQLRVHAASEQGLGMPIIGDRLYGKNGATGSKRLHLHAHKLEFTFPIDHRHYSFESPIPF